MPNYVYPKLAEARKRAKSLGLPTPYSSQRPGKKLYVVVDGREVHFGARGYSDFLQHKDPKRRQRYQSRHKGILLSNGKPAYKDKRQPAFYAYHILW